MGLPRTRSQSLSLASLFSPESGCPKDVILSSSNDGNSLAILGRSPASTCLHLALNHLTRRQQQGHEASAGPPDADQVTARSGEATNEDDGDAHGDRHVLILSPTRADLHARLVEENDGWLADRGGHHTVLDALERSVECRFIATAASYLLFCSAVCSLEDEQDAMLAGDHQGAENRDVKQEQQNQDIAGGKRGAKTAVVREASGLTLRKWPSLVIVRQLSDYLREKRYTGAGIEALGSLISATLAAFGSPTTQMVFLDDLERHQSIPLLPSHLSSQVRRRAPPQPAAQARRNNGAGSGTTPQTQTYLRNGPYGPGAPTSSAATTDHHPTPVTMSEPRKIEAKAIFEYFCGDVLTITEEGGVEDLMWYEVHVNRPKDAPTSETEASSMARASERTSRGSRSL